jgi:hypothetical protein
MENIYHFFIFYRLFCLFEYPLLNVSYEKGYMLRSHLPIGNGSNISGSATKKICPRTASKRFPARFGELVKEEIINL